MKVDAFSTVADLGKALRRKEVSAVELAQFYLGRLKTLGAEHCAIAELTEDLALAQAKEADRELVAGRDRGPLHGIPYGAKDLLATKGIPTRWGSPGHSDQVFDFDATAVRKLRDAGAVLIAKLAMIELAGGGDYSFPGASATGACACAWDKKRWAGGSSSGTGAAIGLGAVPFGVGSETSGSITCPCAFNGVSGIRPTYGRVSRYGAMALCWTLDKVGPMGRTVDDCARALEAMAGHDPLDPSTRSDRLSLRPVRRKLRIGLLKEQFKENQAAACERAYDEAVKVLRGAGYGTVEVAYPRLPYGMAVGIIVAAEGASSFENFIRGERLTQLADPVQSATLAASLETRAVDYLWALRLRTEALKANEIWEKCDAIFTPVFYRGAPAIDRPFSETFVRMGGDGGPANLLGWPTAAFPIGFDEGAPLGGQFIAAAGGEAVSVQLARDYQRRTDWHLRRPPGVP